ncbi:unnamed protein product [Vitrella brassicaformis CCMP3155]|uniref:Uncharacterized protein n=3 Tax=Vitrella brassicaformis TaxID=1169539 RepID=A0A0G4GVY2_VITBC|nr:unnamed protein product [Vitrella brassicaformis CCMP3155]|eukprot:CEM35042.1 unnamed protein product [Vitrella brassicaformis CCMP3155]
MRNQQLDDTTRAQSRQRRAKVSPEDFLPSHLAAKMLADGGSLATFRLRPPPPPPLASMQRTAYRFDATLSSFEELINMRSQPGNAALGSAVREFASMAQKRNFVWKGEGGGCSHLEVVVPLVVWWDNVARDDRKTAVSLEVTFISHQGVYYVFQPCLPQTSLQLHPATLAQADSPSAAASTEETAIGGSSDLQPLFQEDVRSYATFRSAFRRLIDPNGNNPTFNDDLRKCVGGGSSSENDVERLKVWTDRLRALIRQPFNAVYWLMLMVASYYKEAAVERGAFPKDTSRPTWEEDETSGIPVIAIDSISTLEALVFGHIHRIDHATADNDASKAEPQNQEPPTTRAYFASSGYTLKREGTKMPRHQVLYAGEEPSSAYLEWLRSIGLQCASPKSSSQPELKLSIAGLGGSEREIGFRREEPARKPVFEANKFLDLPVAVVHYGRASRRTVDPYAWVGNPEMVRSFLLKYAADNHCLSQIEQAERLYSVSSVIGIPPAEGTESSPVCWNGLPVCEVGIPRPSTSAAFLSPFLRPSAIALSCPVHGNIGSEPGDALLKRDHSLGFHRPTEGMCSCRLYCSAETSPSDSGDNSPFFLADFLTFHCFGAIIAAALNLSKAIVRLHFGFDPALFHRLTALRELAKAASVADEMRVLIKSLFRVYADVLQPDRHGRSRYTYWLESICRGLLGGGAMSGYRCEVYDCLLSPRDVLTAESGEEGEADDVKEFLVPADKSPSPPPSASPPELCKPLTIKRQVTFSEDPGSSCNDAISEEEREGEENAEGEAAADSQSGSARSSVGSGSSRHSRQGRLSPPKRRSSRVWAQHFVTRGTGKDAKQWNLTMSEYSIKEHLKYFVQWCSSAHLTPFLKHIYHRCGVSGFLLRSKKDAPPVVLPSLPEQFFGRTSPLYCILHYHYGGLPHIGCRAVSTAPSLTNFLAALPASSPPRLRQIPSNAPTTSHAPKDDSPQRRSLGDGEFMMTRKRRASAANLDIIAAGSKTIREVAPVKPSFRRSKTKDAASMRAGIEETKRQQQDEATDPIRALEQDLQEHMRGDWRVPNPSFARRPGERRRSSHKGEASPDFKGLSPRSLMTRMSLGAIVDPVDEEEVRKWEKEDQERAREAERQVMRAEVDMEAWRLVEQLRTVLSIGLKRRQEQRWMYRGYRDAFINKVMPANQELPAIIRRLLIREHPGLQDQQAQDGDACELSSASPTPRKRQLRPLNTFITPLPKLSNIPPEVYTKPTKLTLQSIVTNQAPRRRLVDLDVTDAPRQPPTFESVRKKRESVAVQPMVRSIESVKAHRPLAGATFSDFASDPFFRFNDRETRHASSASSSGASSSSSSSTAAPGSGCRYEDSLSPSPSLPDLAPHHHQEPPSTAASSSDSPNRRSSASSHAHSSSSGPEGEGQRRKRSRRESVFDVFVRGNKPGEVGDGGMELSLEGGVVKSREKGDRHEKKMGSLCRCHEPPMPQKLEETGPRLLLSPTYVDRQGLVLSDEGWWPQCGGVYRFYYEAATDEVSSFVTEGAVPSAQLLYVLLDDEDAD